MNTPPDSAHWWRWRAVLALLSHRLAGVRFALLSRCRRTHWLEFAQFRRSRKRNSSAVKLPLWLFCWLEITSRYSLAGGVQRFHKLQRLRSSANAKRAHSHSNLSSASKFTQFRCSRLGLKRLLQSAHKRSANEAYGSIRWQLLASLMTIR